MASRRVSIIVPARNEAENIRETLMQLLALDYSNYEIIAVNDRSRSIGNTGRSKSVTQALAACRVHRTRRTESALTAEGDPYRRTAPGWLGKTHAMWTAGQQATGDWLLFTDADVLFKPDALRRAVAYAEAERADHVVLFPRMIMKRPGERMMIAFFQALFVFGHRPWKVADPKARDHMGVGAFNMVRRSVYDAVGTYRALRMEVLDDMKLGKVVKNAGFAQRNVFGEDLISLRWAKGAFGIVNNLTKNFFAVLSFQWSRTVVSIIGLGFLNLGPFLGVLAGARMGANSLRRRACFTFRDLLRNVDAVGRPALLFLSASGQHHPVHVHPAALHGPHARERRHRVAGNEVSAGRAAQGDGVAPVRGQESHPFQQQAGHVVVLGRVPHIAIQFRE